MKFHALNYARRFTRVITDDVTHCVVADRKFTFKHKESKEKVGFVLEHGSLLVMKDETQSHWLHQLPKTKSHPYRDHNAPDDHRRHPE